MSQPSRAPSPAALAAIAIGALALGLLVFWSRRAPADLPEWTPADHDQPAGQATQGPPPSRPKTEPQQDAAALAEVAWGRSCAACHGERGRGDGPQSTMVRAPDLTRVDWQGRVTDDEIRQTIRTGRNNMPKFDLPPAVLDGIVKRIRANRSP
jgi:mono/diheme cytochrome c family protein